MKWSFKKGQLSEKKHLFSGINFNCVCFFCVVCLHLMLLLLPPKHSHASSAKTFLQSHAHCRAGTPVKVQLVVNQALFFHLHHLYINLSLRLVKRLCCESYSFFGSSERHERWIMTQKSDMLTVLQIFSVSKHWLTERDITLSCNYHHIRFKALFSFIHKYFWFWNITV